MPNLPIYSAQYSDDLASVERHNLDLEKIVDASKRQSIVFKDLADKMIFDVEHSKLQIEISSLSLSCWQNILYMCTTALTVLLAVWCFSMHIRRKTVTAAACHTHAAKAER